MSENNYNFSQIANATARLFKGNVKLGLDTASYVRKAMKKNLDSYTWGEINEVLCDKGWSTKHLADLMCNLKNK